MKRFTIAIHGGAGTILQKDMTAEKEKAYQQSLEAALEAGYSLLQKGGTATDAVIAATVALEDDILFNAGRGSVFTKDGKHEMDAAIMEGSKLDAGAVAGIGGVRNPIALALEVMRKTDHVFLSGQGAMDFAASLGWKPEADDYFFSAFRHKQWQQVQHSDQTALDHNIQIDSSQTDQTDKKFGTVGAVACDSQGNIAAATSTGGMTNKRYGRIGDSPLIGCGTYANNQTCAISCTGHGELFIRAVAAYDVSCLMEYKGLSLHDAMQIVVNDKLVQIGGEGGMVGVDAQGNAAMLFNSEGMYRGMYSSDGQKIIAIYS